MEKKNIMDYEKLLPEDFDGIFRFTNPTEEEFIGVWDKKEYHFPPMSTTPIFMPSDSPLNIQSIRKKFAKDLAEREFGNTEKYKTFLKRERNSDGTPRMYGLQSGAGSYTLDDLAPMIQKCLIPLANAKMTVSDVREVPIETKLSRDEEGKLNTKAVRKNQGLDELRKDFEGK